MSPAEPDPAATGGADAGATAAAAPRHIRCEACLEVLASRHTWDSASCRCGGLTVSGPPRHPRIAWTGRPGGGWSDVTELEEDEPGAVETEDLAAAPARRSRIGYLP